MTKDIDHETASTNILAACEAGTLAQGKWHGNGNNGRAIACLLGSIDPDVNSPKDCSANLMPLWMAKLTVTLFDGIAPDQIYPVARRYGGLVGRWHVLRPEQWKAILERFLVRTIDAAVEAARPVANGKLYWNQIEAACDQCKAAIGGSAYAADAAADAAANAANAADAAADAAANAANAADAAAYAAAKAAAKAADAAAYAAADAAANAADAAADAAAYAAADAARYDQHHKLFTFLLDQIEQELTPITTEGERQ